MKPDLTEIKNAAYSRWPEIHAALGIPAKLLNTRKHQPCPHCGGKDRFRYTDHKHGGGYICNRCAPETQRHGIPLLRPHQRSPARNGGINKNNHTSKTNSRNKGRLKQQAAFSTSKHPETHGRQPIRFTD